MMLQIALALGVPTRSAAGSTPVPTPTGALVQPDDFVRDRIVFDSGAARGANAADIPLSGRATTPGGAPAADGTGIEARIVDAATGQQVHPWTAIATVAGGDWSGTYPAATRNTAWLRAELRAAGSGAVAATASRFAVGHVAALIGQSEDAMMFSQVQSAVAPGGMPAPVPVLDPDALQIVTSDESFTASQSTHRFITDATPVTASMTALSNVLAANAPGEKFALIDLAHSGTSRQDLANDGIAKRLWSDLLITLAVAGTEPGLILDTWTAADSSLAFKATFTPFYTGRLPNGTTYALGTPEPASGQRFDHILFDLDPNDGTRGQFDPARTRILMYGPHRFELQADMTNALNLAAGGQDANLLTKQTTRLDIEAMTRDPLFAPVLLPYGPQILAYSNGYDNGSFWTDRTHPTRNSRDGLELRARHTAHALLWGMGLVPRAVPQFDAAYWDPSGAHVDIWSSAGDVTTTRHRRGEGLPPNSAAFPHRTQVVGFEVNGVPSHTAVLQADAGGSGRVGVRITPNAGGSFTYADQIAFGRGGASGTLAYTEDMEDQIWKDYPIVDTGLGEIEGVAVRSMPDPAALANTLPPPPQFTVAGSTYFQDPAVLPAGTTSVRFEIKGTVLGGVGTAQVLATAFLGNHEVQALPNGAIRLYVTENGGFRSYDSPAGVMPFGQNTTVVSIVDLATGTARVLVDGNPVIDRTISGPAAQMATSRRAILLSKEAGQLAARGTFDHAKVWLNDPSGAGAPHKTVAGPAATVNADPWKRGADAT